MTLESLEPVRPCVRTGSGGGATPSAWVDEVLQCLPAAHKKDMRHSRHLKSAIQLESGGGVEKEAKAWGYARQSYTRRSYMSDCLLLRSPAESCDTAKCRPCTCPWNDHRQCKTPRRNNLIKFKANKFTHHCQFPIHYLVWIHLSLTAWSFDVYFFRTITPLT